MDRTVNVVQLLAQCSILFYPVVLEGAREISLDGQLSTTALCGSGPHSSSFNTSKRSCLLSFKANYDKAPWDYTSPKGS